MLVSEINVALKTYFNIYVCVVKSVNFAANDMCD